MDNITLKKVAEHSGVSLQTVSKILNGKNTNMYKAETQKRVLDSAQFLNYRPNAMAQAIKNGSFKTVMLLKSSDLYDSLLSSEILMSIQNHLDKEGYKMMLTILPHFNSLSTELPRFFKENYVDGVIVNINKNISDELKMALDNMRIPKVWIGSQHKCDWVAHDDFTAGVDLTSKLIENGHKNIVYFNVGASEEHRSSWHFSVQDRMEGYKKAMISAGLKVNVVQPNVDISQKDFVDFIEKEILDKHNPTGVVAYSHKGSGRSFLYACAKRNIRVPEDISLVTWSDHPIIENGLSLSSMVPAHEGIGKATANLICKKIQNPSLSSEGIVFNFQYILGDTIGKR